MKARRQSGTTLLCALPKRFHYIHLSPERSNLLSALGNILSTLNIVVEINFMHINVL